MLRFLKSCTASVTERQQRVISTAVNCNSWPKRISGQEPCGDRLIKKQRLFSTYIYTQIEIDSIYHQELIIDIHQLKPTQCISVALELGLTDSRELKVKLKFLKHPTRPSTSGLHFEKEICRSQRQRPPRRRRPWQKRPRHHRGRWQKMTMLRQRLGNKRVTAFFESLIFISFRVIKCFLGAAGELQNSRSLSSGLREPYGFAFFWGVQL